MASLGRVVLYEAAILGEKGAFLPNTVLSAIRHLIERAIEEDHTFQSTVKDGMALHHFTEHSQVYEQVYAVALLAGKNAFYPLVNDLILQVVMEKYHVEIKRKMEGAAINAGEKKLRSYHHHHHGTTVGVNQKAKEVQEVEKKAAVDEIWEFFESDSVKATTIEIAKKEVAKVIDKERELVVTSVDKAIEEYQH